MPPPPPPPPPPAQPPARQVDILRALGVEAAVLRHLRVVDRDHFTIAMDADDGDEISFVRASLRELMQWDEPAAPTYGFFDAMTRCGIEPEVPSASLASLFEEVLHHTHGTVLLDQVLLVAPLLLVGGWHVRGGARTAAASLVFSVVGAVYLAALIIRLSYLGIL